jgi:alanine racemase
VRGAGRIKIEHGLAEVRALGADIIESVSSPTLDLQRRQSARPTWAEVSLSALRENFRTVQHHVGPRVIACAVIKADAYGHGATPCALALEAEGATWFGVTTTDEGVPLRVGGLRGRILLMTGFWRGEEEEVVRQSLTATVWEPWHVESLNRAARRLGVPAQPVHLKVDTGMGRLGATLEELPSMCQLIRSSTHLTLEGLSTHFASAEILDQPQTGLQVEKFQLAARMVNEQGLSPVLSHMDNTAAIFARPETWRDMVRPGLALYGYALPPVRGGKVMSNGLAPTLRPVLSWKTRIVSIRDAGAGQPLGYNGTYVTNAPSRIAVLPVGYADGYNRALSNRGRVVIRGAYAPIVGLISMDLTLVDITGVAGAQEGDEVVLIGQSGSSRVDAPEVARHCGTVPYEILCAISKRVPRLHIP